MAMALSCPRLGGLNVPVTVPITATDRSAPFCSLRLPAAVLTSKVSRELPLVLLMSTALLARDHWPALQVVVELRFMVRPSSVLVLLLAVRPPLTLKAIRLAASLSVMVPNDQVMVLVLGTPSSSTVTTAEPE